MDFARERFTFAPDAEIGIEVDPRVTSREHLETLRNLGFNRLSLGIQDFHPEVQEAIHRVQPYEATRDMISYARELGFDSINVDLIYGLPYQNAERFPRDGFASFDVCSRPRGDVQLRARAVAAKTARRVSNAFAGRHRKIPYFLRGAANVFWTRAIFMSAWTISRGRATNWPWRNKTALCIAIFRDTQRRPARIFTAWA